MGRIEGQYQTVLCPKCRKGMEKLTEFMVVCKKCGYRRQIR